MTLYRSDGTTSTIASGSENVTGLPSGTTYKFYPYVVEGTAAIVFVAGGTGVGTPAVAYPASGNVPAAALYYEQTISP